MQVTGHDDVCEHVPGLPMTERDRVDDHPSDVRPLEMGGVFSTVEPGFHLGVDTALELEPPFGVVFRQLVVVRGQRVNAILSLLRNRTGEMERDEVSSVGDLPVWQTSAPERDGFRFANHGAIPVGPARLAGLGCRSARGTYRVGPASRAGLRDNTSAARLAAPTG